MSTELAQAPVGTTRTPPVIVIDSRGGFGTGIAELMARRELLYFLIWRDIKVRYKQTVLGVAWAVLLPLLQSILFTVIFGHFAKISPDGDYPYAVFVLAGLIPWSFFSQAVSQGSQSLINQSHLLTKVYFPRLYVPMAAVGGCLIDFGIGFGLYAVVLLAYGIVPPASALVVVPLLALMTITSALGIVFLLAALTVTYRDFKYVIPFAIQVLMYASPIIYPVKLLPQQYQWVLGLNPITGLIDGYRSALLGKPWDFQLLGISLAMSVGCMLLGVRYFRRTERKFADLA